jgi:hypothetical protein
MFVFTNHFAHALETSGCFPVTDSLLESGNALVTRQAVKLSFTARALATFSVLYMRPGRFSGLGRAIRHNRFVIF